MNHKQEMLIFAGMLTKNGLIVITKDADFRDSFFLKQTPKD